MNGRPIALVVDDDPEWQRKVRDRLDAAFASLFEVVCESTGEAALDRLRRHRAALVILDAMLEPDKPQGADVLREIRTDPALQRIPVVMLTGVVGVNDAFRWDADEHVAKHEFERQFAARVDHLLARAATWPFESSADPTLSLFVRNGAPVDTVLGVIEYREQTKEALDVDIEAFKSRGRKAYGPEWHTQARDIGRDLYRDLVKGRPEIAATLRSAFDRARRVNVAGKLDWLEVPLEFLPNLTGRSYFVLHHPFSRSVIEARPERGVAPSISPKLLNDLHRDRRPLRVLLVASDTGGIPKVDQEVESIRAIFVHNTKHLRTEVTVLKTADATLAAVSRELESGAHHIVHYAGHGEFVKQRILEHRLALRGTRDVGVPDYLDKTKLQGLWGEHRPSLFYMSCCRSSASGEQSDLVNNDLLGLMDAALCAGVPSAIGFRWPVSDHGAYDLALAFYDELLKTGRPDHALCAARGRIYRERPEDPAWLSPVLVMQPP